MRNDEIEIIRELTDELNFARQFLTNDNNYKKIKDLTNKIEELEKKLDTLKVDFDKEYFENLKKEIEKKREELLETFDKEIMLFKKTAEDFERRKNYLLNTLKEIKQENDKIKQEIRIFNKAHLFFTLLIFIAAAAIGFYFGVHHFKF